MVIMLGSQIKASELKSFELQSLVQPIFAWPFFSGFISFFICQFFLTFHYALLFLKCEIHAERMKDELWVSHERPDDTMGTVYLSSFIAFTLHGDYKEQTRPTYIRLTMASNENLKLTGALGNIPQNINSLDYPGFYKETPPTSALKTLLAAHLLTPSCLPPLLAPASLTPIPTPPIIITT